MQMKESKGRDRKGYHDNLFLWMMVVCQSSEYYPLLSINLSFNTTYAVRHGSFFSFIQF